MLYLLEKLRPLHQEAFLKWTMKLHSTLGFPCVAVNVWGNRKIKEEKYFVFGPIYRLPIAYLALVYLQFQPEHSQTIQVQYVIQVFGRQLL